MKLINGVKIKKLKVIPDDRGRLMEVLRKDDELFLKFGQVYITTIYPGIVKAWHYHKKQTDNMAVISGMARLVLYDSREKSSTYKLVNEIFIGEHNPLLVQIPFLVYHGFKNIGDKETIIVNCPTNVYNYSAPDEIRLPFNTPDIPYDWNKSINY